MVNELEKDGGFIDKSPRKKAINFIESIVRNSGGVALFPEKIVDLPKIAKQISDQMRTQFVIKFLNLENLDNKKIEIKPTKTSKNKKLDFNFRAGQMN